MRRTTPSPTWRKLKPLAQAAACVAVAARWVERVEVQLEELEFERLLDPGADLEPRRQRLEQNLARARSALARAHEIARAVGVDPEPIARRALEAP